MPIDKLAPYPRNARLHSDKNIADVMASMRHFGWTVPVLIDEAGMIIAGHARTEAAKRLGLTEVPCLVARGWSEEDKRAYVIGDNQLTLNSSWDENLLKTEFGDLRKADFDLTLTGFDLSDVDAFSGLQVAGASAAPVEKAKTTIFLSVPTKRAGEARKLAGEALKRAGIDHNL